MTVDGRGLVAGAALAAAAVVSAGIAISVGTVAVPLRDVAVTVAGRLGVLHPSVPPLTQHIVWELRAPRAVAAALVGAGLSVAGAVVQSLTRNPLADPYLLGVSAGSALGAVTVLVAGTAGGLLALLLVLAMATGRDGSGRVGSGRCSPTG